MTSFLRSGVWDREETWEGMFYDAVHTEREILGMNRYPLEMQDRFRFYCQLIRVIIANDQGDYGQLSAN